MVGTNIVDGESKFSLLTMCDTNYEQALEVDN